MGLLPVNGFFSYAHADDISQCLQKLRGDLCEEYSMLTGEALNLFIDRDGLAWGVKWQESITAGIDSSMFFIPVLTPRYFQSTNCLKELGQYLAKVEIEGAPQLILPILFVDVDRDYLDIDRGLLGKVLAYQYEDWTDLRFVPRSSERYKRAINKMAERLLSANIALERAVNQPSVEPVLNLDNSDLAPTASGDCSSDQENEERDGILDSFVKITESNKKINDQLQRASSDLIRMGEVFNAGTEQLTKDGAVKADPQKTLIISRQVASNLMPIASSYSKNIDEFSGTVFSMDHSMRVCLTHIVNDPNAPASEKEKVLDSVINLSEKAEMAREQTRVFLTKVSGLKNLSRALAKPVKTIESATNKCLAAFDMISEWGYIALTAN